MSTYALLHEDVELALIFDIEELLAAIGRVRDVQLFVESAREIRDRVSKLIALEGEAAPATRGRSRTMRNIASRVPAASALRLIGDFERTFILPVVVVQVYLTWRVLKLLENG